jgi:hypothetical protein
MPSISKQIFESLIQNARALKENRHGVFIYELANGHYLKVFRAPTWFSTGRLWPYSKRFIRAADRLNQLGIPTVKVIEHYSVGAMQKHMVEYVPIEGDQLRQCLQQAGDIHDLIAGLAQFLAHLHHLGIYFRGIHFENIIHGPNNSYGLIDMSGTKFKNGPLSPILRARNFRPLLIYNEDRKAMSRFGLSAFVKSYLEHAKLSPGQRSRFLGKLACIEPHWSKAVGKFESATGRNEELASPTA